jgi:hypothetical protein
MFIGTVHGGRSYAPAPSAAMANAAATEFFMLSPRFDGGADLTIRAFCLNNTKNRHCAATGGHALSAKKFNV